jgi:integrase/recombinase XerD
MSEQLPAEIAPTSRLLTAAEFHRLADVLPEIEWFANLSNPSTRRAYENAIRDFMRFTGIAQPEEFRAVTRAHRRLARRARAPRARRKHGPAPACLVPVVVRLSLRKECRHPQSGQRRRAAEDGKRRRQNAGARRLPGTRAAGRAAGGHAEEQARPGHPVHVAVPRSGREELCKLNVRDFRHARKGVPI